MTYTQYEKKKYNTHQQTLRTKAIVFFRFQNWIISVKTIYKVQQFDQNNFTVNDDYCVGKTRGVK
jgi:hypothetical protein